MIVPLNQTWQKSIFGEISFVTEFRMRHHEDEDYAQRVEKPGEWRRVGGNPAEETVFGTVGIG